MTRAQRSAETNEFALPDSLQSSVMLRELVMHAPWPFGIQPKLLNAVQPLGHTPWKLVSCAISFNSHFVCRREVLGSPMRLQFF